MGSGIHNDGYLTSRTDPAMVSGHGMYAEFDRPVKGKSFGRTP